jgi:hypothetical protein
LYIIGVCIYKACSRSKYKVEFYGKLLLINILVLFVLAEELFHCRELGKIALKGLEDGMIGS